jgi:hypothetical protein
MNKKKKKLLIAAIAALVVIFIGVLIIALSLDGIVKKGIETIGPQITKVSITVNEVHIGPLTGFAKVKGLVVGNPGGYKMPNAINVGVAAIGVNPLSVLSKKIVIRSIQVESPEITFEGNPLGKNNLGDIMDNVNATARSGVPASTNPTSKAAAKSAQKIEVDDFLVTGAKVHVSISGMSGKEMTLPLPDIHLTNLGKGGDGLTPADLTRAAMSAITSATIKAVANAATNLGTDAGKVLGKDADKIKKGVGGLFGK